MVRTRSQAKQNAVKAKPTSAQPVVTLPQIVNHSVTTEPTPIVRNYSGSMHSKIVGNHYRFTKPESKKWEKIYDCLATIFKCYVNPDLITDLHRNLARQVVTQWYAELGFGRVTTAATKMIGRKAKFAIRNAVNSNMFAKYQFQVGKDGIPASFLYYSLPNQTTKLSQCDFPMNEFYEMIDVKSRSYLLIDADVFLSSVIFK
ncbi:MAG: hypothetical protein AAF617_14710 [Bacteroidota bacterium]